MNQFETELFALPSSGRKGVAYDWQQLQAADGVAALEVDLARFVLEPLARSGAE